MNKAKHSDQQQWLPCHYIRLEQIEENWPKVILLIFWFSLILSLLISSLIVHSSEHSSIPINHLCIKCINYILPLYAYGGLIAFTASLAWHKKLKITHTLFQQAALGLRKIHALDFRSFNFTAISFLWGVDHKPAIMLCRAQSWWACMIL